VEGGGLGALSGRVAFVTGGGRGIGRAISLALARAGAAVAVASRSEAANAETVREITAAGGEAHPVPLDVTNTESVQRAVQAAITRFQRIDILVNNAGSADSEPFLRTDRDLWDRMLAVNLTGAYLCTRAVLEPMLRRRRGRIVNVASTAGRVGYPYVTAYCAAKHGLVGLTRALAQEVAAEGITVNAVCPGFVDTDLTSQAVARISEKTGLSGDEARSTLEEMSPQNRLIRPEEVADLVVTLALDGSGGINGQAIVLDGGAVAG